MWLDNGYYLIIDVEATCSDDGSVPRNEMEIIEIGALLLDARSFHIESEFQCFVRPIRHPLLTTFCTELTGISQDHVDCAPSFDNALDEMNGWLDRAARDEGYTFCSWGDYDCAQFERDCQHHRVPYPFGTQHLNLKAALGEVLGLRKKPGLSRALSRLGMAFVGSPHRGLDDARNIARVVRRVCIGM